jgi:hypothetical protein
MPSRSIAFFLEKSKRRITIKQKCFFLHDPSVLNKWKISPTLRSFGTSETAMRMIPNLTSSNGDGGYKAKHNTQFRNCYSRFKAPRVVPNLALFDGLTSPGFISDFFHLAKNIRSRIMNYAIEMQHRADVIRIRAATISSMGQLAHLLSDGNGPGRIRDSNSLVLFNLSNAINLFDDLNIGDTISILPLSRETRP